MHSNADAIRLLHLGDEIKEAHATYRAAYAAAERCPSAELINLAAYALRKRDRLLDLWPRLQGDQPL